MENFISLFSLFSALPLSIDFVASIIPSLRFSIFPENFIYETIWKFVVMNAIWFPIHFAWLAAGSNIKKLAIQPNTQKVINITMGNLLLLTVILSFVSLSA